MIKGFFGFIIVMWFIGSIFTNKNKDNSNTHVEQEMDRKSKIEKDKRCKKDINCISKKHMPSASVYCGKKIEKLSKYSFKWSDGFVDGKFSLVQWKDNNKGVITYIGDKLQFQNGFGAWQNIVYECDFDISTKSVLNARVKSGRLQ